MKSTTIILLAAGSSSRMGQSKQLLRINNEELLLKATNTAIQSHIKTLVVLGSNEKDHRHLIHHLPVEIMHNPDWEKGMGSSLKAGLNHALKMNPTIDSILVMVCDQPLLKVEHLKKIQKASEETDYSIIASYYSGTPGVPALFHRPLFAEISDLPDDHGAKKIIEKHLKSTKLIEFPEGATDLDTPEDLDNFNRQTIN